MVISLVMFMGFDVGQNGDFTKEKTGHFMGICWESEWFNGGLVRLNGILWWFSGDLGKENRDVFWDSNGG